MKVCHIINNLNVGGAETQVLNLLNKFSNNHDVSLIVLNNKGSIENLRKLEKNIEVYNINVKRRFSLIGLLKILKIIKLKKFDVIHAHLFPSFYYISLLSPFIRGKKIYTEHSIINNREKFRFLLKIERALLKKFDRIIAVSRETKSTLAKKYNLNNVIIINNGVDLDAFRIKKEKNNDKFTIIMVSRFTEAKNHLALIKAFETLEIKNKELMLLGDGPTLIKMKEYVLDNEIKNVDFCGNQNNILRFLEKSDVYVQSSNWESFGIAPLEAMSVGLPVVYTNIGGLRDVCENPELSFDNNDIEKLKVILERLYRDKKFYQKNVAFSVSRSKVFDLDKIVTELEEIYRK